MCDAAERDRAYAAWSDKYQSQGDRAAGRSALGKTEMSGARRMTREDRYALIIVKRIAEAVTAVVNETPAGATGSVLYTALMAYISVDQFETMMRALVAAERIARRGDRYFPIGQRRNSLARRRGSEGRR